MGIPEQPNQTACAVRERTADGVSVGRCWFQIDKNGSCPRHGDVRAVQKKYVDSGELTDEGDLYESRGQREAKTMVEERFFIDHGVIHDRVTGKHVRTGGNVDGSGEDGIEECCALLNELAAESTALCAGVVGEQLGIAVRALDLIAGTHGAECANPRAEAAEALRRLRR
jgi:hypothetical protein